MATDDNRINDQIEARRVRLIGSDGTQHGVVTVPDALAIARHEGLDLVELPSAPTDTPVCKIMNYETYRRERQRRLDQS